MLADVSERGLHVRQQGRDRLVPWSDIDRVTAAMTGQMVGGRQTLVLGLRSGGALAVTEVDPVWHRLIGSLPSHLPGAERAAMWQLELAGGAPEVAVYQR